MTKKNVEDERFEKLEQDIQAIKRSNEEIQRSTDAMFDEIKQLLVKRQWRRRGRSRHPRSREENGEMGESATVKKSIVMRKSEEVEEKMEKKLGNQQSQVSMVAKSVRSFTVPLYDTDDEDTNSRNDWGLTGVDIASDKVPSLEENADEAKGDVVVSESDMREDTFSFVTGSSEGEEMTRGSDERLRNDEHWGRPPEKNAGGATATGGEAEKIVCDVEGLFFAVDVSNIERDETEIRAEWTLKNMDLSFTSMGQAQYPLIAPPQLTNTRRLLQEKNEVQKIVGSFLQAIYVIFPTAEDPIRVFNIPLQSCLITSLFDDHPSPTLAIKRLEELSLETFLLVVEDEKGRNNGNGCQPHFKEVIKLIKLLVGEGRRRGSRLIQLINVSILVPPLVLKWDPGGSQQGRSDMNVVQGCEVGILTCKLRFTFSYSALCVITNNIRNRRYYTYHDTAPTSERVKLFQTDEEPSLVELLFQCGRYLLMFCWRLGTQVANLQGKWDKDLELNINLQMSYWPSLSCNLHECQESLSDYNSSWSMNGRKTAKVKYVVNGKYYTSTNPSKSLVLTLETSKGGGAICVVVLNFLEGGIITSLEWILGQDKCGCHGYTSEEYKLWLSLHFDDPIVANSWIDDVALRLGDYTGLVLFVGGGAIMVIGENRNGILLFRHFTSHQVNMLAIFGIQTCEGRAQIGDDHENVIQADYYMKLKGQVDYGVKSYQSSTTLAFGGGEALQQWDPGELYSASCMIGTSCFKQWDPGRRPLTMLLSRYLHLEDKVNFEGGSIDENIGVAKVGQTNRFGRVYSRRGKRGKCPKVVVGKVVTNYAESANGKGAEVHTFSVS